MRRKSLVPVHVKILSVNANLVLLLLASSSFSLACVKNRISVGVEVVPRVEWLYYGPNGIRNTVKVDGGWSLWSSWSECTCIAGDSRWLQYRLRHCTNPRPQDGGQNCTGPWTELNYDQCKVARPPCTKVDGGWSEWLVQYDAETCGATMRVKYRNCSNPPPRSGGRDCEGKGTVSERVNLGRCTRCLKGEDSGCCTEKTPCSAGEGDCDKHKECLRYYLCGTNNCLGENFGYFEDCCVGDRYAKRVCNGIDDDCCLEERCCNKGDGDCDSDKQCCGSLRCGSDNCDQTLGLFEPEDDCCKWPEEL